MMYRIIISIFCVSIAIAAMAQTETPDSVNTKELNEVAVEGQLQRISAALFTHFTIKRQRNAAPNGP